MLDLAINLNTGDLIFSPNRDFQSAEGEQIIRQRVHARLMIHRPWALDPSGGALGSRLYGFLRATSVNAESSLRAAVFEALAPIGEIEVTDVAVEGDSKGHFTVHVEYQLVYDDGSANSGAQVLTVNVN